MIIIIIIIIILFVVFGVFWVFLFLDVAGFVCFFVGLPTLYFFDLFLV